MESFPVSIEGLLLLAPRKFEDDRGYFFEAWRQDVFDKLAGREIVFRQDNVSFSRRGVLRGLHFQREPQTQGKLVSVPEGRIFDVAVDLRPGSRTFGRHMAAVLSSEDHRMLWIPEGFAHGFLVLSATALVHYKTTRPYAPQCEAAIRWNDPALAISWPLGGGEPLVSAKDASAPFFSELPL
jgi:dTDP-4-dehydrorhamnose 3,5-epimerase